MQAIPIPDVNRNQKIIAGVCDSTVFYNNLYQLRKVHEAPDQHPYFYLIITLLGISLILQVFLAFILLWLYQHIVEDEEDMRRVNRINNITLFLILLLSFVSGFITIFG